MTDRNITALLLCGLIASGTALSAGCAKSRSTSEPVSKTEATTPATVAATPLSPPPQPAEVRDKIASVYRQSVTVYAEGGLHVIAGDFNGDSSQDLAVVVRPAAGKLAIVNSELANWLIIDPHPAKTVASSTTPLPSLKPAKVAQKDLLLAVIHGYGAMGWRDPEARQAFLLRNAAGENMELQSPADFKAAHVQLPLQGDAIKERVAGEDGVLFWTEGKYAWRLLRPPRT